MKKWIAVFIACSVCLLPIQAAGYFFSDLERHWAEEYVYWATFDVPVFSGYPDGSYRPDQPISRAEFITMLSKILEQKDQTVLTERTITLPYTDMVSSHWAYGHVRFVFQYLEEAFQADLAMQEIYPAPFLSPSQPISRFEVALLAHSLTTPSIIANGNTTTFSDISPEEPHYRRLLELTANGMISGYEDGTFRPQNELTRAEAAVMAKKIYQDLSYLTPDRLVLTQMIDETEYLYPTLDMPDRRADFTVLDRRMDNVIATLEYKNIVGFIPFDEKDLYDRHPIETLWNLKNDDYPHVIANNHYLMVYDTALQPERKRELAEEALQAFMELDDKQIDGFIVFLMQAKSHAPVTLVENALKAYLDVPLTEKEEVEATYFLSKLLREQGKYDELLGLYGPLIRSVTGFDKKMQLMQHEVVMRFQIYGAQNALAALERHWENLKSESRYWFYEEEIRHEFTALTKQLMIQQ